MSRIQKPALAVWPLLAMLSMSPAQIETQYRGIASEEPAIQAAEAVAKAAEVSPEAAAAALEIEKLEKEAKAKAEAEKVAVDPVKKEEVPNVPMLSQEEQDKLEAGSKAQEEALAAEKKKKEEEEKLAAKANKKEEEAKAKESVVVVKVEPAKEEKKEQIKEEKKEEKSCDHTAETKALTDRLMALETQSSDIMKFMAASMQMMASMQQSIQFRSPYESVYRYRVEEPYQAWQYAPNSQDMARNYMLPLAAPVQPAQQTQVQTLPARDLASSQNFLPQNYPQIQIAPNATGVNIYPQGIQSPYQTQSGSWNLESQFKYQPQQPGYFQPQDFGVTGQVAPAQNLFDARQFSLI